MNQLTEGKDYYITMDGLLVFTEAYHLERGFCCGKGCRHCPFEYINVPAIRRAELLNAREHGKTTEE